MLIGLFTTGNIALFAFPKRRSLLLNYVAFNLCLSIQGLGKYTSQGSSFSYDDIGWCYYPSFTR